MVTQLGQPKNEEMLFVYAKECWEEMKKDKKLVDNLYNSLPQRMRKVIHNEVYPING